MSEGHVGHGEGSSPLTRGKRTPSRRDRDRRRLIPAHAGKTVVLLLRLSQGRAHPRSRGENASIEIAEPPHAGSSPLTRGKQLRVDDRRESWRLIPAHAGKTSPSNPTGTGTWAHPRSRGENGSARRRRVAGSGSSPLTRGKLDAFSSWLPQLRLIPAHAGKTLHAVAPCVEAEAHPRSRGENVKPGLSDKAHLGSSPLTRGKPGCWWPAR